MKLFGLRTGEDATAGALAADADAARDRGDWRAAARLYAASLRADDAPAHLWVQLGHARKESGDLAGAGLAYQAALERAPDEADTHLQQGHLAKLTGRLEDAAAAYGRAAELDPGRKDAIAELRALLRRGVRLDGDLAAAVLDELRAARPGRRRAPTTPDDRPAVVFDVSDLIGYFANARLPTGIQRVQIEVISALLRDPPAETRVLVCAFTEVRDGWVGLPGELFLEAADLALAGGGRNDPDWQDLLDRIGLETDIAPPLAFPRGAWLINLGTSWWLQNYFLKVREAKRRFGVRYLPFVHDMIPVMAPEHCTRPLTQDFISWALGVFAHADAFLTNSEASRADLVAVAGRLGHRIPDDRIEVVRLDADFRKPGAATPNAATLDRYGLTEGGFVLLVSTIESRKNHLAAFRAWSALVERHGPAAVPTLVCVGNRGWLNDAVFARLESDPALRRKVVMLSGVPDPDLANLYCSAAFTLYPSQYEGWGLPVTESLCYGKAVLASDSSSLPEAGGDFAVYFRQGDQPGLIEALDRLIFDLDHRRSLEARIETSFRPRPWRDLAAQIIDRVSVWRDAPAGDAAPPVITPGRYNWLRRSREVAVSADTMAAEIFRTGDGWAAPDDWGCWTRRGDAVIEGRADTLADGPVRLFIGLLGLPDSATSWSLETRGQPVASGELRPGETRWIARTLPRGAIEDGVFQLRVLSAGEADLSRVTGGIDGRRVTVGVIGFMLCAESDMVARAAFLEGLATGDLAPLAGPVHADA